MRRRTLGDDLIEAAAIAGPLLLAMLLAVVAIIAAAPPLGAQTNVEPYPITLRSEKPGGCVAGGDTSGCVTTSEYDDSWRALRNFFTQTEPDYHLFAAGGAGEPSTCDPQQLWLDTTAQELKICWAIDTWTGVSGGADTTCLDAGVDCPFAGSATEGGPATTAVALTANGTDCSAGSYARGTDASGNAEGCTVDANTTELVVEEGFFAKATTDVVNFTSGFDVTNALGIAQVDLDITESPLSALLPLAGGTLTGEVTVDDLGLEFTEGDALTDCSTFSATGGGIFYDDSEGKLKKCEDNSLSDLDTTGGGDTTRIEDAGGTTYVDADETPNTVTVAGGTDAAQTTVAKVTGVDRTTPTDGDQRCTSLWGDTDDGEQELARVCLQVDDTTSGTEDGSLRLWLTRAGTLTEALYFEIDAGGNVAEMGSVMGNTVRLGDNVQVAGEVQGLSRNFLIQNAGNDSTPQYSNPNDSDSGMYLLNTGEIHLNDDGNVLLQLTAGSTATTVLDSGRLTMNDADADTYFECDGTDTCTLVVGGVTMMEWNEGTNDTFTYDAIPVPTPYSLTCSDSGDANPGTATTSWTNHGPTVFITNADADGCGVSISETGTGSMIGTIFTFTVVSNAGGVVTIADTPGVTELDGDVDFTGGLYDTLTLQRVSTTFVELGRSNN